MDPKDINQLDPKLREAYERVMGTGTNPQAPQDPAHPSAPPVQNQSQQTPPPAPQEAPHPPPVHLDTSQAGQPAYSPNSVTTPPVYQSYSAGSGSAAPASTSAVVHHSSKLAVSTPILVVLGIMFFAAYGFLWIMVFGIDLF